MAGVRPFGVTLVGAIIVIWGVLSLAGGVLALFNLGVDNELLATAIVLIIVGLVYLGVARGLFHGSRFSRLLVAIVTVISLAGGIWTLVTVDGHRLTGVVQALVAIVGLVLLYGRKASVFFD